MLGREDIILCREDQLEFGKKYFSNLFF